MSDLERLLREDARASIADNGFTARVMGALPARAAKPGPWLRPGLVLGSTVLGGVLAVSGAQDPITLADAIARAVEESKRRSDLAVATAAAE